MLKINLAPIEEVEDKFWFVIDLIAVFLAYVILSFAADLVISNLREDIAMKQADISLKKNQIRKMKKDIKRYDLIIIDVKRLEDRIKTIDQITVSKIKRFKTLVLLEKLNENKPDGLWFSYLEESEMDSKIMIAGGALDSLLVAKFISNLKEDKKKQDTSFFNSVYLDRINLGNISNESTMYKSGSTGESDSLMNKAKDSYNYFTDVKGFPIFSLNMKYKFR